MTTVQTIIEVVRRLLTEEPLLTAGCLFIFFGCIVLAYLFLISRPQ